MPDTTYIALVDDHVLLRNGLAACINSFDNYKVLFEADNGKDFIRKLQRVNAPAIVLLDVSMPEMNGYETAEWISKNLPETRVLVLSVMDSEDAIIRMIKSGAKGYIVKDSDQKVFIEALNSLRDHGFYINELVTNKMFNHVANGKEGSNTHGVSLFSEREMTFLKLICTEKTYKEIATEMGVSPRTVDGYRDTLFEKIGVSSRTGLVIYAIKSGIVKI